MHLINKETNKQTNFGGRDEGSKGFGSGGSVEDCGQVLLGEASKFQVLV
jgi:hypothetical protein